MSLDTDLARINRSSSMRRVVLVSAVPGRMQPSWKTRRAAVGGTAGSRGNDTVAYTSRSRGFWWP